MNHILLLALVLSGAGQALGESGRLPPLQSGRLGPEGFRSPDTNLQPRQLATPGKRRALLICGHPGDLTYRGVYAQTIEKLHAGLTQRYGFSSADLWVRFGSAAQPGDGPAVAASRGPSTREAIAADAAELRRILGPQDALWVIVVGHAHYDGRHAYLNLPGPDLREDEFGGLFEGMHCREQVFFITTPVSGFFVKPLSAPGRIVITATEADLEVNETLFHLDLAEVLSNPPEEKEFDRDRDGRITVLDLYLTVARRVLLRYQADKNIPTEHAQLDDNGDGRPTELQLDYLEPELGGRPRRGGGPVIRAGADGVFAATVTIPTRPLNRIGDPSI